MQINFSVLRQHNKRIVLILISNAKCNKKAVLSHYHTVWDNSTENLHLILGQVNRNKSKTIGKHGDVIKKLLYKCIIKGLMHVAARYHGTLGSIGQTSNAAKFRCTSLTPVTKCVWNYEIYCQKILVPGKVGQKSPQVTRFVTRIPIDTLQ